MISVRHSVVLAAAFALTIASVTAVVQPGGSMRGQDSIAACDEHGMAMVFTGVRHFRH